MSILNMFKKSPQQSSKTTYNTKKDFLNFLYHNANPHMGTEIYHVDSYLRKQHPFNDLHPNEKLALNSYSHGSSALSDELLQSHKEGRQPKPKVGYVHLPTLDAATQKFKLPKMTTFSGVSFDPRQKTRDSNGLMYSPALISSSVDPMVANDFAAKKGDSHILRIHVPEGQHGIYLGNDLNRSAKPEEHELLLPRGIHLKINPKPTVFTHESPNSTKHVWDAHIVPQGHDPMSWQPPHTNNPDFTRG